MANLFGFAFGAGVTFFCGRFGRDTGAETGFLKAFGASGFGRATGALTILEGRISASSTTGLGATFGAGFA